MRLEMIENDMSIKYASVLFRSTETERVTLDLEKNGFAKKQSVGLTVWGPFKPFFNANLSNLDEVRKNDVPQYTERTPRSNVSFSQKYSACLHP